MAVLADSQVSESIGNSAPRFPHGEHYVPLPDKTEDGKMSAHAVQTILVQPQALYELWKDIATFSLWQEHVVSVTPVSDSVSHWVVGDPEDPKAARLEFDSEIVEDKPGQKISWRSISTTVDQSGEVTFTAREDGRGTLVTLIQNFRIPGGSVGAAAAAIAKRGPRQTVIEDLRHFKQLAETGEIPSVKGQPHGPRGLSGGIKEWMYGETNPTPPGTSELA